MYISLYLLTEDTGILVFLKLSSMVVDG